VTSSNDAIAHNHRAYLKVVPEQISQLINNPIYISVGVTALIIVEPQMRP
jgi:hypothetical protein